MPGTITPTLESLFESALAFCASGRSDQARRLFEAILAEAPWHIASAGNLAMLDAEAGNLDAARERIRRTLTDYPSIAFRFGTTAHAARNRFAWDAALEFATLGCISAPEDESAWFTLGEALARARNFRAAESCYRHALDSAPQFDIAGHAFARMLILLGRAQEGYRYYPAIRTLDFARTAIPPGAAYWNGQRLDDKTVLVVPRLGLGDTIQYARYLPELRRRAAQLTVQIQPPLLRLLGGVPFGSDPKVFDYCTAFDELPAFLPPPPFSPYVSVSDADARAWSDPVRRGADRTIGIVYASNPREFKHSHRSIEPPLLAPLLSLPGTRFVSLQVDSRTDLGIDDLGGRFTDFFDTACALRNLDLLISIDTSVVHLAGAMGLPGWVLLPFDVDPRWGLDDLVPPLYPSLRLFRQGPDRNWRAVIETVARALENF